MYFGAPVFVAPLVLLIGIVSSAGRFHEKSCLDGIDILQLQDMTSSFDPRWMPMAEQVGDVLGMIAQHESARFSFSTFGDKPVSGFERKQPHPAHDLGYNSDYCLKVDTSLERPDVSSMVDLFMNYQAHAVGGGGDWPEGVLDALYRALLTNKVGWRPQDEEKNIAKVIVLVTDAVAHLPGEAYQFTGNKLRPFDITEADMERHDDENFGCSETEYPGFEDVASKLREKNIWLLLMIAPGGIYKDGEFIPAASIAYKGKKYRGEDGLRLWYEDEFSRVGVSNLVTTDIDFNMTQYTSAYSSLLEQLIDQLCPTSTTTTTTKSTTTTTTTRTTTTTTTRTTTTTTTRTTTTTTTTKPRSSTTTSRKTTTPTTDSTTISTVTVSPTTTTTTTPGCDCCCCCCGCKRRLRGSR